MRICRSCGLEHSPMIRCEVARNLLERADAQKRVVIESRRKEAAKANGETPLDQPVIPVGDKTPGVDRSERRPLSKRWDKAAYNLYMRGYMREWRKRK